MEKEFVTYEIALKLKELGFNGECFSAYILDFDTNLPVLHIYQEEEEEYWKIEDIGFICDAPLWQQAIDWLRTNNSLYLEVYPFSFNKLGEIEWTYSLYEVTEDWRIFGRKGGETPDDILEFPSYEKAREAGVIFIIEWIRTR